MTQFRLNKHISILLSLLMICFTVAAQPTVDFSANKTSGCVPLSGVNFTDLSYGGTIVNRHWDLGNGTIIPNGSTVAGTNYLNDGSYTVRLTVTFASGEVLTAEKVIVVHPKPIAKFSASVTEGCAPLATQFTDESETSTGTITSRVWDFGATGSTAPNPSYTFTANGNYNVSLLVTNSWGCASEALTVPSYIKVYPRPQASFTIPVNASCEVPFTADFINTTTGSGTITYTWDFGNGNSSTETNPSETYTTEGAYRVRLTAQNGPGCTNTFTAPVDIYVGNPTAQIIAPTNACTNAAVNFNAQVTPSAFGQSFRWTFGENGPTRTGRPQSFTFTTPGTYKITLEVTNPAGCSTTTEHEITVREAPSAKFSADKTSSCQVPVSVQFTPDDVSANIDYLWTFGDGQTSTDASPIHTYNTTGNFTVTLRATDNTDPNGCTTTETRNSLIRIQRPSVNFNYVPPSGCKPLPVRFIANVSNLIEPVANYIWDFGDGNSVSVTTPEYTHIYTTSGIFSAKLTIQTVSGCTEQSNLKSVSVVEICDDDGSGGGGAGGAGLGVEKNCSNKYTVEFTNEEADTEVISWDFGDGSPLLNMPPIETVTHTFPTTSKQYIVTVTRRHIPSGNIYEAKKRVIIIDEKADFTPDFTDICAGKTVQFTPQNINPASIATYTWDFGDGSTPRVINNQAWFNAYGVYLDGSTSYTYNDNGTYNVTLTITDKLGCSDETTFATPITVKGPEARFSRSVLATCDPSFDVEFTDQSIPNGTTNIVSWQWNFGDGQTQTETTGDPINHTYTNSSSYREFNITLLIRDELGCESSATQVVKAYQPRADFSSADVLTCGKYTINFSNTSSARNATYVWEYGDGTSASGYAPSHTYSADGDYTIKLTATDENGCVHSEEKSAYIRLVKPVADFTVEGDDQCAPVALVLKDNSTFANTFSWDFGDNGTGTTDQHPSPHIYAVPGFYDITLKIRGVGGCESSVTKTVRVKGPIGALQTGATTGCAPFTFDMRVTGTNITSYAWDFGDGTPVDPSNNDQVTHIYPSWGKYTPNVVLSSPEGCQYTLRMTDPVIVDDVKANFSINRYEYCDTALVEFHNNTFFAFGNTGSFTWKFGDGTTDNDENPEPHIFKNPGNYTVTLEAESLNGCRSTYTESRAIHVATPPDIDIPGSMEQCAGIRRTFVADIASEDPVTGYRWLLDEQPVGHDAPFSNVFGAPGTYSLALAVQTLNGCLDTLFRDYIVHRLPVPAAGPNSTICTGEEIMLSASDGVSYEWTPALLIDDPTAPTPVASPLSDTRFTVRVTNEYGCEQEETIVVKVDQPVSLQVGNNAIICLGDRIRLNASGNTSQFTWSPASGLSDPNSARPFASPQTTTVYRVTGHSTNVCPDESATVKVTVGSIPTVDLGPDQEHPAGRRITLSPVVSSDVVSYEWTPATGLTCTTCPSPQFNADKNITYRLRVKTEYNCEASDEINIRVLCGSDAVYIPNAFTPNGDGHNDVFYIRGYGMQTIKRMQIFDRWGKVVYSASNIQPNDASKGWNGQVGGLIANPNATFVYIAEVVCHEGNTVMLKGTVTVVR